MPALTDPFDPQPLRPQPHVYREFSIPGTGQGGQSPTATSPPSPSPSPTTSPTPTPSPAPGLAPYTVPAPVGQIFPMVRYGVPRMVGQSPWGGTSWNSYPGGQRPTIPWLQQGQGVPGQGFNFLDWFRQNRPQAGQYQSAYFGGGSAGGVGSGGTGSAGSGGTTGGSGASPWLNWLGGFFS